MANVVTWIRKAMGNVQNANGCIKTWLPCECYDETVTVVSVTAVTENLLEISGLHQRSLSNQQSSQKGDTAVQ
jgi:hypothetical protein